MPRAGPWLAGPHQELRRATAGLEVPVHKPAAGKRGELRQRHCLHGTEPLPKNLHRADRAKSQKQDTPTLKTPVGQHFPRWQRKFTGSLFVVQK